MKRKSFILQGSGLESERACGGGEGIHTPYVIWREEESGAFLAPPWPLNYKVKNDGKENFPVEFPHVVMEKVRKTSIIYWDEAARIQEESDKSSKCCLNLGFQT